jgi:hypothetical protein
MWVSRGTSAKGVPTKRVKLGESGKGVRKRWSTEWNTHWWGHKGLPQEGVHNVGSNLWSHKWGPLRKVTERWA